MFNRIATPTCGAVLFAAALVLSHTASAGRVILNNDEWTLSNTGFGNAPGSTTTFAQNLASYMNIDGGACNLLVYSSNFGLTESSLASALVGGGCSVSYSTGTFTAGSLSAYDGVLLGGMQYGYDAGVLTAYINSGHSAYLAAGTASMGGEDTAWDSFSQAFGLDFGPSYNGIMGTLPTSGSHPLFAGVSQLYFNNGNTVSLYGSNPNAQIVATHNLADGAPAGLIGVYDDVVRIKPQNGTAVPEPATLALLGFGLAGLGFSRRRSR